MCITPFWQKKVLVLSTYQWENSAAVRTVLHIAGALPGKGLRTLCSYNQIRIGLWGWQPSPRCSATAAGLASAGRPRPRTAGVWGSRTRPSGSAPCGPVSWPVGESHGQLDVMHGQGPPGQLESLNDQPHPLYHLIYCPNDHVASFNHGKWE